MGETKFEPREFPLSGSKPIDVKERREKKRERAKVNYYNGPYLSPEPIYFLYVKRVWHTHNPENKFVQHDFLYRLCANIKLLLTLETNLKENETRYIVFLPGRKKINVKEVTNLQHLTAFRDLNNKISDGIIEHDNR